MERYKKKVERETWVKEVKRNKEEIAIIRQRYAES